MKKLTKEQKQLIKGGSSIAGIVQGAASIIYAINMGIDLGIRYFAWNKNFDKNYFKDTRKYFINSSSQKTTIFS